MYGEEEAKIFIRLELGGIKSGKPQKKVFAGWREAKMTPRSQRLLRVTSHGRRYNFSLYMQSARYALVAYVKGPVGEFVESLRRELHPGLPLFIAHLTLLPPRPLRGAENAAVQTVAEICGRTEPFEVTLGGIDSFAPTTPTVYIRVAYGAMRMWELHEQLNTQALEHIEEWAYIPHLTIAKLHSEAAAIEALRISGLRWEEYTGSRRILVDRLTFVREDSPNCWVDLAPLPLGGTLVNASGAKDPKF